MRVTVGASVAVVLVAALAMAGVGLLAGPGDVPPLSQAEALTQARRYGEALAVYEHLATRYPHNPQPYLRIGAIRQAQGLPVRAAEAVLLGLARDPQNAAGLHLLGNIYADQGERTLAAEKFRASLIADPAQANVRVALGHVLIAQGQLGAAQAQMAEALGADPARAEAHYYLALLVAPHDAAAARPHLTAAATDPAFVQRAADFKCALSQVETARQAGGDAYALTTLGAGYLQVGEPALALPVLQHAVRIAPKYADAHAYLGHAWWLLGALRSALAELDTAIAQDAKFAPAHHWRGLVLHSQGRYAEARAAFQQALALQPADAAVCADQAATYEAQRDYVNAEEWYQKATELAPDDCPLALRQARFYVEHAIKVRDAGRQAASRATELLPRDAEAWELLGWAQYLSEEPSAARRALERSVTLDVDRPSAHYRLGEVLRTMGREEKARCEYQLAIDLAPEGPWAAKARQAMAGQ